MSYLTYFISFRDFILNFMQSEEGVSPILLPDDIRCIGSTLKGESIEMKSYAWQGVHYRYARLTHLQSEDRIEMLNFTIYPHYHSDSPLFASDFVCLGHQLRVGVVDAMPIFPDDSYYQERWVNPFKPLHAKSLKIAPQYERKLDWSFDYMSPYACMATGLAAQDLSSLFGVWRAYFELYIKLHKSSTQLIEGDGFRERVRSWHDSYNASHLAIENQRNPLMHYFGKSYGLRYNSSFLFGH